MRKLIMGIVLIILWAIIGTVSLKWYNKDFANKADNRHFYQSANRIDNKEDFDYLLDTGGGRSIVQADLSAVDSVSLSQVNTGKKYASITAKYQEYLPHTETYTETHTDSNGNVTTEVKARTVWEWENVGKEHKEAKTLSFFGHSYSSNLFMLEKYEEGIPVKDIIKGSKETGNKQYTRRDKRTIWYGVPAKFGTTFYADLTDNGLKPIQLPNQSRDKQIRLHKNQPIKVFLQDELESNTPHPIIWTIITIVIMIVVALGTVGIAVYVESY